MANDWSKHIPVFISNAHTLLTRKMANTLHLTADETCVRRMRDRNENHRQRKTMCLCVGVGDRRWSKQLLSLARKSITQHSRKYITNKSLSQFKALLVTLFTSIWFHLVLVDLINLSLLLNLVFWLFYSKLNWLLLLIYVYIGRKQQH